MSADTEFPMTIKDILKFECLNAVSINVASKMDRFFLYGLQAIKRRSTSREKLQLHAMDYGKMNDCAIRLPSEDKWLDFGNYCNKERVSFIVYDLKCVLRKMELVREDAYVVQDSMCDARAMMCYCCINSVAIRIVLCGSRGNSKTLGASSAKSPLKCP
ncbi:hypothetical protein G5I_06136 [Acromyrmex echinatior]|uniref:Uncharacterized protein n=1 Tax=Acromyrmex echinatior TaxID=103372 RepID=F4WK85_ACREC|nr:hypothetical protein G5I_06136 [Acromyrmex echinatior]